MANLYYKVTQEVHVVCIFLAILMCQVMKSSALITGEIILLS